MDVMGTDEKAEIRCNKQKKQLPKNRRTKSFLIFNEKSRVEFITGFRKRKKDRQKKVQEEINKKIKEERKLLKQKRKEFGPCTSKKYQSTPPDLEDLAESQVTELPDHTVTVTDISDMDIAGQGGTRLGRNRFQIEEEQEEQAGSGKKPQISSSISQISLQQQHKVLRQIGDRIHKRQKHVTTKIQHSKGRTPSKKKKHMKKHSLS